MHKEMNELVTELNEEQRKKAMHALDAEIRDEWHYVPRSRDGLAIKDMTDSQKSKVFSTLKRLLSEKGFFNVETIIELERLLQSEASFFSSFRDPGKYYLQVFGTPSSDRAWALSFEGHHLSLNYVFQGDRIVSFSPLFFGANPAEVRVDYKAGPSKGTRPLAEVEDKAFELVNALSKEQLTTALVSEDAQNDVRGGGSMKVAAFEKVGISSHALSAPQKKLLAELLNSYAAFLPKEVIDSLFSQESRDKEASFFSWSGSTKPGSGHYYRVDHPRFLIEFANTQDDVSGNPANHVHALFQLRLD